MTTETNQPTHEEVLEAYRLHGEIRGLFAHKIMITALKGSSFKPMNATKRELMLAELGADEADINVAIEVCDEFERLIRDGNSTAETLETMLDNGWLNRIEPWEDDLEDQED